MVSSIQLHFKNKQYQAAIQACRDAIDSGNQSFELHFLLAGAYYLDHQYKPCQSILIEILEQVPKSHHIEFTTMLHDCNQHIHSNARITLIGDLTINSGFGYHLRALASALSELNISFVCIDSFNPYLTPSLIENTEFLTHSVNHFDTDIVIFCCGIYRLNFILNQFPRHVLQQSTCIYYGNWEFPDFPTSFKDTVSYIDHFWMPSKFSQDIFHSFTKKPVHLIPIACSLPTTTPINRADFSLSDSSFIFLFTGHIGRTTISDRKNPTAIIRSFLQAFPKTENVCLILKLYSTFKNSEIPNVLNLIPKDEHRIKVINENFTRDQLLELMQACDCYVSLHRCEGYGLGMIEAMALGKPVIATNYSGNTTFMTHSNSCLVDYKIAQTEPLNFFSETFTSSYAEADIDHAAHSMQRIYDDHSFRNTISNQAKLDIETRFSLATIHPLISEQLQPLLSNHSPI